MRDKTIGCICTCDDAIECMRERYNALDDDSEGEACSCCCHDYMQDEEEAKSNTLKRCLKCGKEYQLDHFSRNMSTEDHLERWCKECKKKAQAELRARRKKEIQKPTRPIRNRDGRCKIKTLHPRMPVDQEPRAITLPVEAIVAIEQAVAKKICAVIMEHFGS